MSKRLTWLDDYWLLLMQIYLRKPVGIKAPYSRSMVELALELHIHPQILANKMRELSRLETPRIERIWQTYGDNSRKLARAARLLREMKGFGRFSEFYDGVDVNETWEKDWQPLQENERLTPVMLILVLDQYFRLTPATMVSATPEVQELAQQLKLHVNEVVELMGIYQYCDPCLNRRDRISNPLLAPCQSVWQRYGNGDPKALAALAMQLQEYYK